MSPAPISVYTFRMVNPINVFLIDDDTLARNGLTRLLRAAHFDVQPFSSADDFLDALGSSQMRVGELCASWCSMQTRRAYQVLVWSQNSNGTTFAC